MHPPGARAWRAGLAIALLHFVAADAAADRPQVLTAGGAVSRDLAGGQTHDYVFSMDGGQFAEIRVIQRGIDVVLELLGTDGAVLFPMDSGVGSAGEERVCAIASSSGWYGVRIRAFDPHVVPGAYQLRIHELHAVSPGDRARVEAQRLFVEGMRLEKSKEAAKRQAAIALFARAASTWRAAGDTRQESVALLERGILQRNLGDLRPGAETLRRSAESAESAGDRQLEGKALDSCGIALGFLGEPDAALAVHNRALDLARAVGDRQAEADALRHIGEVSWRQGRYQEALDRFEPALAIAVALRDNQSQASTHNGLGLAYASLGEFERALDQFERAIGLAHSISDSFTEAFSRQNMGYAYWRLGAYRKALEAFESILPARRAAGERQLVALIVNNMGLAHLSLGEAAAARRNFEEAYSVWTTLGDERSQTIALVNLGLASKTLNEIPQAISFWEKARDRAVHLGLRDSESAALAFLARAHADEGDPKTALSEIESALAIVERERGEIAFTPLRATFLSSKQNVYAIGVDVLLSLHARSPTAGFDARAFQAAERGRARGVSEGILEARLDLSADLPEDLRQREAELGTRIHALEREAVRVPSDREAVEARLIEAEREWNRLIAEMRRRTPKYASLRYPEPISFDRVRGALDAATALVSYSANSDRTIVFVVTRDGLRVERLAISPSDLAEHVEHYVGLIARSEEDAWSPLSERLYRDLVAPWRARLPEGIERLIVVPDGALSSLPFEALVRPGSPPRRLAEDFVVSYAPSATVLAALRETSRPTSPRDAGDLLVFADPRVLRSVARQGPLERESFNLSPLPYAAAEARGVARFGGRGTRVYVGSDASESRLKKTALEQFDVVHFATHGLLSPRVPSRSALLLAGDRGQEGLLTAREIYRLKLRSEMVVLSGCETARGKILAGEGVQGLAQAFFHAGARSVLASLWDVSDRRTADLMAAFYGRLAKGQSKAEALRGAKLDLLHREPRLPPRYWAAFVLLGEPGGTVPLRRPAPFGVLPLTIAGSAVAAILGLLFFRRRRDVGRRDRAAQRDEPSVNG